MYRYDEFDDSFVRHRVARFREQIARRLDGSLSEEEFRPLRLQNGLYLQLHAYMLRVAIPYGTFNATQMRQLAMIAEKWDRGFGHFTTRQNIQYNWPKLTDVADILEALADVEMHAIQTSGNCVRNVTTDHFAGAAADELLDPRAYAEMLRQYSSGHPEFAHLPRKFKIAITGSPNDRAVTKAHDIGLRVIKNDQEEIGFEVSVGGGLGRTPMIGKVLRDFLPEDSLLPYIEAILRVYNQYGRRDNKYKARIKILVHEEGIDTVREKVEAEFQSADFQFVRPSEKITERIKAYFKSPDYLPVSAEDTPEIVHDSAYARWLSVNTSAHKESHYRCVSISLKPIGGVPGDITAEQMRLVADLAETLGHNEIRASHEQNLILPHIPARYLHRLYTALQKAGLAEANVGLVTDMIACPGMDYCSLATARSIPIAQELSQRFADPERQQMIGEMHIKISGCINACGHHHVGHIGILGLDKAGSENYQVTLGGDHTENMAIGTRAGPGFDADKLGDAIERLVDTYVEVRKDASENFPEAYRRLGAKPFQNALYPDQA